jgi:hypothetical protein
MVATPPSVVEDYAIRLADEGVPLRAIARATRIPSEDLRQQLIEARDDGRLVALPHDDWPPGFPRDQRSLQLSRLAVKDKDVLMSNVRRIFCLTRNEAVILLALIQSEQLAKYVRSDMSSKTVDVHICRLRKYLRPFKIEIQTLWGFGYRIAPAHRHRAMNIILRRVRLRKDKPLSLARGKLPVRSGGSRFTPFITARS